jgi:hypothetical protein
MSRVNNTIDKFGRQNRQNYRVQILRGPPGTGFKLTADGQYDIDGKSLTNVAEPTNSKDAATKEYVLRELHETRNNIVSTINNEVVGMINKRPTVNEERVKKIEERINKLEKSPNAANVANAVTKEYLLKELHGTRQSIASALNNELNGEIRKVNTANEGRTKKIEEKIDKIEKNYGQIKKMDDRINKLEKRPNVAQPKDAVTKEYVLSELRTTRNNIVSVLNNEVMGEIRKVNIANDEKIKKIEEKINKLEDFLKQPLF